MWNPTLLRVWIEERGLPFADSSQIVRQSFEPIQEEG